MTAYVRQTWEDSRLKWDPNKYSGTMDVHLPASLVWKPDIVLLNTYEFFFYISCLIDNL
jgi:hypothetical protein